jgi:hypothetical protein
MVGRLVRIPVEAMLLPTSPIPSPPLTQIRTKEAIMKINPNRLLSQIPTFVLRIISFGLLALLCGAVVQRFGLRIPYVPTIDVTQLVYLCGAWWLCSK